jgi:hypothetical protein
MFMRPSVHVEIADQRHEDLWRTQNGAASRRLCRADGALAVAAALACTERKGLL